MLILTKLLWYPDQTRPDQISIRRRNRRFQSSLHSRLKTPLRNYITWHTPLGRLSQSSVSNPTTDAKKRKEQTHIKQILHILLHSFHKGLDESLASGDIDGGIPRQGRSKTEFHHLCIRNLYHIESAQYCKSGG